MAETTTPTRTAWRKTIEALASEHGPLELTPVEASGPDGAADPAAGDEPASSAHQSWRVRLLKLEPEALVVERPWSATNPLHVEPGRTVLSVLVTDGNQRWSFASRVIEQLRFPLNRHRAVHALRLSWPEQVHDAQRRDYFRVDTAAAPMPPVVCWPLKNLASTLPMQQMNRQQHSAPPNRGEGRRKARASRGGDTTPGLLDAEPPEIGEPFEAIMVDVSGGGACLSVPEAIEPILESLPMLWLRIKLPQHHHSLYVTARIAHWRQVKDRGLRLGVSFYFDHDPEHGRFITDQMHRFATFLQRQQLQRKR